MHCSLIGEIPFVFKRGSLLFIHFILNVCFFLKSYPLMRDIPNCVLFVWFFFSVYKNKKLFQLYIRIELWYFARPKIPNQKPSWISFSVVFLDISLIGLLFIISGGGGSVLFFVFSLAWLVPDYLNPLYKNVFRTIKEDGRIEKSTVMLMAVECVHIPRKWI